MADISKTTADKLEYSRAVEEAYAVHGREVAMKLDAWLFAGSAPRALTTQELFDLIAGKLGADGAALAATDLAHQVELGDDTQPRVERDHRADELTECIHRASDVIRGAFGVEYARIVGLEAPLAERPVLLVKQARTTAKLLRETPPPPARGRSAARASVSLTTDEAELIEEAASALDEALTSVKREEIEAQKTLLAREEADAVWARTFGCAGDLLAVAATVAGLPGVAERVKTNWRRRVGLAAKPNVDDTPTGDEDPNAPGGPFGPPLK